jgi:sec-independent protein translocase protein TatA
MSLGTPELIVIFVLVLLLFGPNKLPELARSVGKGLREFRKISSEVQNQIAQLAEDEPAPRASRTSAPGSEKRSNNEEHSTTETSLTSKNPFEQSTKPSDDVI